MLHKHPAVRRHAARVMAALISLVGLVAELSEVAHGVIVIDSQPIFNAIIKSVIEQHLVIQAKIFSILKSRLHRAII